eukprot:CAMPEP_0174719342 /NCGR_PEP_ID=MMETSP1094-20130205/30922_1 /TAXON_ID=156173 /ORGANISM="Chrysochromulina brevifilum, Strain UTEX LB 985" /LENGTH=432 /DNA_ID=CAMNT_0015919625 /DNA_START=138 /DNA_END=1436 /DNA_ORIENTATION=-
MNGDRPPVKPSQRVLLNVGGRHFETTAATLSVGASSPGHYFSSLLRHTPESQLSASIFIDRDGDAFGPLLNFLRTGTLNIPPTTCEAAVRSEADFYCITLPYTHDEAAGGGTDQAPRCDGMYLSFAPTVTPREGAADDDGSGSGSEVRAYLMFEEGGRASLGRREADGQWSALRCRYRCLSGGLLLVHHDVSTSGEVSPPNGGAVPPHATQGGSLAPELAPAAAVGEGDARDEEDEDGLGQLELSAVILGGEFIRVMACGRVGRLENPFHFFASHAPSAGTAFISQVATCPPDGRPAGRVLLSFEDSEIGTVMPASSGRVGVMVTSSQPGWASAAVARYETGTSSARTASPVPLPPDLAPLPPLPRPRRDSLCHVRILDNANFSRTVDLVSLGEQGLVEFVQLNSQHEPQLIWYRPLLRAANPWATGGATKK